LRKRLNASQISADVQGLDALEGLVAVGLPGLPAGVLSDLLRFT
jgi:hypothetical protein